MVRVVRFIVRYNRRKDYGGNRRKASLCCCALGRTCRFWDGVSVCNNRQGVPGSLLGPGGSLLCRRSVREQSWVFQWNPPKSLSKGGPTLSESGKPATRFWGIGWRWKKVHLYFRGKRRGYWIDIFVTLSNLFNHWQLVDILWITFAEKAAVRVWETDHPQVDYV